MEEWKLYEGEYRFMNLIWENEPVNSTKLCRLALVERGFATNEQATVTALVERQQVQKYESERVVEKNFGGSLPAFLTSFLKDRTLTKEEADEIREMIERAVK